MGKVFMLLALIIQCSYIYADNDEFEYTEPSRDDLKVIPVIDFDDGVVKEFHDAKKDWIDMFLIPGVHLHPTSSAALMSQATKTDKSPEEQLEDIKEIANKITMAIQSEMANLLSFALANCEKEAENENNSIRKRRSVENPIDSTQLVMRLLKHIKSNNEYQNIAIEKMMSAQEIADKYGIEFNPDPDMLSDLAIAANEQAKEMTEILKDAVESKNVTAEKVEFVPLETKCEKKNENDTYYVYSVHHPQEMHQEFQQSPFAPYEYIPEQIHNHHHQPSGHHDHHRHHNHHDNSYNYQYNPYENYPTVTPKPDFYDAVIPFTPDYFAPFCMEPVTTTTTIILPIDEVVEPEPELVGEEYEETVSSKVFVDHEEPGSATVNHVMTYTLSEKAHFKTPEIEKLPQQMQYSFFLM